jgi:hypothetical protein
MNPRLEQLRKRYLNPPMPSGGSGAYTRGPRSIDPEPSEEEMAASEVQADAQNLNTQESAPMDVMVEKNSDNKDGQDSPPAAEAVATDNLGQGIATLFEPARRYRDRVSLSFESIRSLQTELGTLAQAFEPLKGLQGQIYEVLNTIRAQLGDLAMSLEAAKALRLQLSELVDSLETGAELQTQIHELSKALGTFQAKSAVDEKETPERAAARIERRARA